MVVVEAEASTISQSQMSVVIEPIVICLSSELSAESAMSKISASTGFALLGMSLGKIRLVIIYTHWVVKG